MLNKLRQRMCKAKYIVTPIAIIIFIYGWLSVNIYLPALPSLGQVFHTSLSVIKLSITIFLLGIALAQLFWGAISEHWGRKNTLFLAFLICVAGIIMVLCAHTIFWFNLGRLIEAIGLGAGPVLGRAIIVDTLNLSDIAIAMAYSTICTNLLPSLAPILGGHLLIWFGWRSMFIFLLVYCLILLVLIRFILPETNHKTKSGVRLLVVFKDYLAVIKHRRFIGSVFPYIIVSGAMIGFYTAMPFVFVNQLHVAASHYGFYLFILVIAYIAGAMTSRVIATYVGSKKMIIYGFAVLLLAIILSAWFSLCSECSDLTILNLLLCAAIYNFSAGLICPNSNALAMDAMRDRAGSACAVLGCCIYGSSALFSTVITALSISSFLSILCYFSVVFLLASSVFYYLIIKNKIT